MAKRKPYAPVLAAMLCAGCATGRVARPAATAGDDLRFSGARVHFATPDEAQRHLGTSDAFTQSMSGFDRQSRMNSAQDDGEAAFLRFAAAAAREWSPAERTLASDALKELEVARAQLGLPLSLPAEVVLVKTSGGEEAGAAYTRGACVILPERMLRGEGALRGLLAHELFHVLSRGLSSADRDALYASIGFARVPAPRLDPARDGLRITNPDGHSMEHAVAVDVGGVEVPVVPVLYARTPFDDSLGRPFFAYLSLELAAAGDGRIFAVEDTDYATRVPAEHGAVIHPDELLADDFMRLLTGHRTPATQRLAEVLRSARSPEARPR